MNGVERQVQRIRERALFRQVVDELSEDGIALLISRRTNSETKESELRIVTFGDGRESEYLGLNGYAQGMLFQDYFGCRCVVTEDP